MDEMSALCHPHNIKKRNYLPYMHAGLQVAFRFLSKSKREKNFNVNTIPRAYKNKLPLHRSTYSVENLKPTILINKYSNTKPTCPNTSICVILGLHHVTRFITLVYILCTNWINIWQVIHFQLFNSSISDIHQQISLTSALGGGSIQKSASRLIFAFMPYNSQCSWIPELNIITLNHYAPS